jgi:tRNA 2-thiocytidine biosynthesis protein TtcA
MPDCALADRLAYYLLKKVNKAIRDYHLLQDGDRIAVAVSGGKDSMSLLRLLQIRQTTVPERYDLIAVHVRSDYICTDYVQLPQLEAWFQAAQVPYTFEYVSVLQSSDGRRQEPGCFWCSWNRRKALFLAAHRLGANKVAFGHHADDMAETALLNLFYHGRLESMEPRVEFFNGLITVIRPLIYIPEKELARYARASNFPTQTCHCPNSKVSRRTKMKELLRTLEADCPQVKINLSRAVSRLNSSTLESRL